MSLAHTATAVRPLVQAGPVTPENVPTWPTFTGVPGLVHVAALPAAGAAADWDVTLLLLPALVAAPGAPAAGAPAAPVPVAVPAAGATPPLAGAGAAAAGPAAAAPPAEPSAEAAPAAAASLIWLSTAGDSVVGLPPASAAICVSEARVPHALSSNRPTVSAAGIRPSFLFIDSLPAPQRVCVPQARQIAVRRWCSPDARTTAAPSHAAADPVGWSRTPRRGSPRRQMRFAMRHSSRGCRPAGRRPAPVRGRRRRSWSAPQRPAPPAAPGNPRS